MGICIYEQEKAKRRFKAFPVAKMVHLKNDSRRKLAQKNLRPFRIDQVHTNGMVTLELDGGVFEWVNIKRIDPDTWIVCLHLNWYMLLSHLWLSILSTPKLFCGEEAWWSTCGLVIHFQSLFMTDPWLDLIHTVAMEWHNYYSLGRKFNPTLT